MSGGETNERMHVVVVNDEEQYSIWPADRPPPAGWRAIGPARSEADCLAHIDEVWVDMRPASLRRALDGDAGPGAGGAR